MHCIVHYLDGRHPGPGSRGLEAQHVAAGDDGNSNSNSNSNGNSNRTSNGNINSNSISNSNRGL